MKYKNLMGQNDNPRLDYWEARDSIIRISDSNAFRQAGNAKIT